VNWDGSALCSESDLQRLIHLSIAKLGGRYSARYQTTPNRCKHAARAGAALALLLTIVTHPAGAVAPFLSPVEIATGICSKSALAQYPGTIEHTEVLYDEKSVRIEVYIVQNSGKGRLILCDGTSGKIISAIDLDAP
jgi:hypothetical protein